MPRTLADDLVDDVDRVFLQAGHFSETGQYTPSGGEARGITYVVLSDSSLRQQETHHKSDQRTLRIYVYRSSSNGINDPQIKDKLVTDAEPGIAWDYRRTIEANAHDFILEFTSKKLLQSGYPRPVSL